MEHEGQVNGEQVSALNAELTLLREQQREAALRDIFIRMSPQEANDFEVRRHRISEINVILWAEDPKI
jgi:hypothetical protein